MLELDRPPLFGSTHLPILELDRPSLFGSIRFRFLRYGGYPIWNAQELRRKVELVTTRQHVLKGLLRATPYSSRGRLHVALEGDSIWLFKPTHLPMLELDRPALFEPTHLPILELDRPPLFGPIRFRFLRYGGHPI
jgi:hypothetical protein